MNALIEQKMLFSAESESRFIILYYISHIHHKSKMVCFSMEMMGHPDLAPECDAKLLEPLLPQEVVNNLLSKYLATFTVSEADWMNFFLQI